MAVIPGAPAARSTAAKGGSVTTSGESTTTPSGTDGPKSPTEVLRSLSVDPARGLAASEAAARLAKYGPNALVEKEESLLAKILGHFTGPIAYMIEAAAIVSATIGHWDAYIRAAEQGLGVFEMDPNECTPERQEFLPVIRWLDSHQAVGPVAAHPKVVDLTARRQAVV